MLSLIFARTRPDAPRLDSEGPLGSFPAGRPGPLKAKRSHRKADPDAAHRYTLAHMQTSVYIRLDRGQAGILSDITEVIKIESESCLKGAGGNQKRRIAPRVLRL